MAVKIAGVLFSVVLVLFFLSVFAPMQSKNKFWLAIHKFRAGVDFVVYWFFNLCAILSISYLVLMTLRGLF